MEAIEKMNPGTLGGIDGCTPYVHIHVRVAFNGI